MAVPKLPELASSSVAFTLLLAAPVLVVVTVSEPAPVAGTVKLSGTLPLFLITKYVVE
jgi:hypothetical protein